jgi:hypothetical protein
VEEWFVADNAHGMFSMVIIYTVLGLDPVDLRRALLPWHQRVAATPPKPRRLLVPVHRPLLRAA